MSASSWGISLAIAALMGILAGGPGVSPASGVWLRAVVTAAVAANVISSFQLLASARTAATWLACAFVYLFCSRLDGEGAKKGNASRCLVIASVIASGTALAVHGLYQSLYAFEPLAREASASQASEALQARIASGRAYATLGLPGALAGMLAISLPLTLGWALRTDRWRVSRALAWLALLAQTAGMVATKSAAGALTVSLSGAAVLWWRRGTARGSRHRAIAILLIMAGLAGAGGFMASRRSAPTSGHEGAGPLALRLGNWLVAARIFVEHPVLGAGAGCYGIAFPRHRTWEMNETRFAHNSYLQLFSEGGIVIGATGAILAAWLAWSLRRRVATAGGGEAPFLAAACLSFLVHNLADFTFYLPTVAFAFFALAGLATPAGDRARGDRGGGALDSRLLTTASALGLAAFALVVTRGHLAKEEALRLVVEDPPRAAAAAADAVRANPLDAEAHSLLSNLLLERGLQTAHAPDLADAETEALRALELDPQTPHHWHHLGRVRLGRHDPLGALVALTGATHLYPIKIEYRQDRDAVVSALNGGKEGSR